MIGAVYDPLLPIRCSEIPQRWRIMTSRKSTVVLGNSSLGKIHNTVQKSIRPRGNLAMATGYV